MPFESLHGKLNNNTAQQQELQDSMYAAERVFRDLILDYPDCEEYYAYYGITSRALEQFEEGKSFAKNI